jgi:hypothetical protein
VGTAPALTAISSSNMPHFERKRVTGRGKLRKIKAIALSMGI